jgi:sec-independent protein translocase protein TatC
MKRTLRNLWRIITFPFRVLAWIIRTLARGLHNRIEEVRAFFAEEVDDAPVGEALGKAFNQPQDLLVHVDALRKHLVRAALALVITTSVAFTFFEQIMGFLTVPLKGGMSSLVAIEVTEPIGTVMRVSLFVGFALAFPYIALELWLFVAPGVSRRARIWGLVGIPIGTLFFISGMAFAYYVMLPAALPFLLNFMGITTIPRPSNYVNFITSLLFWIGLAFEFPLVIFLMAKMHMIRARQLLNQWRLAIVAIAVIAAMVTPTVDPVNMGLVMLPMSGLYFLSIVLAWFARPNE